MDRKPKTDFSKNAVDTYLDEIRKVQKSHTLAEEQALSIRIRQGDKHALNELVQANLRFVVAVCGNYQNQGMAFGDLISEGNLGLIRAAQRFDGSLNFKFISYAVWWIRQAILAALADHARIMKVAPSRITMLQRIGKAGKKLEQKLGRPATLEELSTVLNKSVQELTECVQLGYSPLLIDKPSALGGDGTFADSLTDPDAPLPDEKVMGALLRRNMKQLVAGLEEKEREVLQLYFGLDQATGISLDEIGSLWGLTGERVRQIKDKALQKLRHPSRIRYMTLYKR